jgi:hypothetical protein
LPGSPFLGNRLGPKCVGHIEATISEVKPLIEALGATTNNDNLFAAQGIYTVGEFSAIHESALSKLFELDTQG